MLFVALKQIVRIDVENYHLVLLSGLFPWIWFQTSLFLATPSFASSGALIKKVPFPRFVLPFSVILNSALHFLLTIPVMIILLGIAGFYPDFSWLIGIPVLMVVQLALLMGTVLLIASLDVFFRDLEHLVEVILQLLFYATPILYPLDLVPDSWRSLMLINPLAPLIDAWRGLFLDNSLPGVDLWPTLLFTVGTLAVGVLVFRRLEPRFADAL